MGLGCDGSGRRVLADYRPPDYTIQEAHLTFRLDVEETVVEARLSCSATADRVQPPALVLDGRDDVKLLSLAVQGRALDAGEYSLSPDALTLPPSVLPAAATHAGEAFEVATRVALCPRANTLLQGLFVTGGHFCTDNEAEGFRGITFFLDRPDVLAKYTVRIEADRAACPVLLCNGDRTEEGQLPEGRHYAVWTDPHPKPSYLFALVAGQLSCVEGAHVSRSGRTIQLRVWAAEEEIAARRAGFALASLQRAMRWEEETWGFECDLDLFQIVAVPELNGGAMENTGLNIFDASLVLACPATATDDDYMAVERTVAHEYFHHQTGNRVTVRDWFQLTLKEGLTVYREQEFGAARQFPAGCARIEAAADLRDGLLDEDSGPLAHAPRPAAVGTVENFYSDTVYSKGVEIVRMFETALGRPAFEAGLKAFLAKHAGGAATCEDLAAAMAAAGPGGQDADAAAAAAAGEPAEGVGWDARLMLRWYDQAGTPTVEAAGEWNANARTYTLRLSQRTEPTAGQPHKRPVPIPVAAGLLSRASGRQLPLRLAEGVLCPSSMAAAAGGSSSGGGGSGGEAPTTLLLLLTASKQTWVFSGVDEEPVPSLLRGCSAPVVLSVRGRRDADLALLAAADPDPYARWDACQELATRALLKVYRAAAAKAKPPAGGSKARAGKGGGAAAAPALPPAAAAAAAAAAPKAVAQLAAVLRPLLADAVAGAEFAAWAFFLPGDLEVYLREEEPVDPGVLQATREALEAALAAALRPELAAAVAALDAALASGGGGGGGDAQQQQQQQQQQAGGYVYTAEGAARRSLRHACLYLLASLREPGTVADLQARLAAATSLTDAYGAAEALDRVGGPARAAALAALHDAWGGTVPGLHAWMALVAGGEEPGNLAAAAELAQHPRFQQGRPAAVESLYHAFAATNANFHCPDGSGYRFIADAVLQLDGANRQQAAGVAACLADWQAVEPRRGALMRAQLQRLADTAGLSAQVREVVEASLEEDDE